MTDKNKGIDALRRLFEAGLLAHLQAEGYENPEMLMGRRSDGEYVTPRARSAWWAWKASLQAALVVFPDRRSYIEEFPDLEGGEFNYARYLTDLRASIEAQGIKCEVQS